MSMQWQDQVIMIGGIPVIPGIRRNNGTWERERTMLECDVDHTLSVTDGFGYTYGCARNESIFSWTGEWGTGGYRTDIAGATYGIWAYIDLDQDGNPTLLRVCAGYNVTDYWQISPYMEYQYSDFNKILSDPESWDDTPEADGETTPDNFGGEFADRMPFDETYTQSIDNILSDLGWETQTGLDPYSSSGNSFFTPYVLSQQQFAKLGYCLFSSSMWNTMAQWVQGVENPLQGFLRCLDFPCALPMDQGGHTIAVFGQDIFYTSPEAGEQNATGHHLTSRYKDVNCGSISLKEVWGTARDYTDTNVTIYLPFVGMRDLDPQLCVGRVLTLLLRIDAWTGDIVYVLNVDNDSIGGKWFRSAGYVYRWTGNCASELPIGRIDNDKGLTTLLGGLGGIGVGIASGNALAFIGGDLAVSASLAGGIKKNGQTSGNLTGNTGVLDIMYPYIVVQRAVPNYPKNWRNFIGATKGETYLCSDLAGYTLFEKIHLEDMEGASEEEMNELERVLTTEGIIF